jgi:uncharacterized membrane protein YedE/YeeE
LNAFTPLAGAAGGILIGLAAWVFYRGVGRIAGISGILAGVASGEGRRLKALFVIGLLAGAATVYFGFGQPPAVVSQADRMWLILAGLLVGFGTRLGSGCTSGHGVCGLARLSKRSFAATATFFAVAVVTVYVVRHVIGN